MSLLQHSYGIVSKKTETEQGEVERTFLRTATDIEVRIAWPKSVPQDVRNRLARDWQGHVAIDQATKLAKGKNAREAFIDVSDFEPAPGVHHYEALFYTRNVGTSGKESYSKPIILAAWPYVEPALRAAAKALADGTMMLVPVPTEEPVEVAAQ